MKKIRFILSMMIIATMAFQLVGCGKTEEPKAEEATATEQAATTEEAAPAEEVAPAEEAAAPELVPEEGATLKLWFDNDAYAEQLIAAFNAQYPDITVTYENVGTTDTRAKIELDGPTGNGADVFVQPHDGVAIAAESGLILPVETDRAYITDKFLDTAVRAVTYKEQLYAYPLTVKTIAFFYNKALVKEAPKTWKEVFEFAKTYNDPSKNKFAMVWQANEPYFAHGFLAGYGYKMFGDNMDDKNKLNLDTPEALAGMEFYKTLHDIFPVASTDATWDVMNSVFSAGEAPFAITGPWSIQGFKDAGVDFGVTQLPMLDNGQYPRTFNTVDTACVSSFTLYPNAATILAKFMTTDDAFRIMYETKVELPALKDPSTIPGVADDANLQGVGLQAANSDPMPFIPEMSSVWDPYKKAFSSVWDGTATPKDALLQAQQEFNTAIEGQ